MMAQKLVIFDVDQTLINVLPIHDTAFKKLFRNLFNTEASMMEIDFVGNTVEHNIKTLAELKKIPKQKVEKNLGKAVEEYEQYFVEAASKKLSQFILPGVRAVLEGLKIKGHIVAVITGSAHLAVEKILKNSNLKHYFDIEHCSSEAKTREEMIQKVIEDLEKKYQKKFKGRDIIVIGDSIHDIDAGKKFNALTIAVLTGYHSKKKLQAHKPDFIFKNLDEQGVLEAIE